MIRVTGKTLSHQNTALHELLSVRQGVTAVAGSGGKTTLLKSLGTGLASIGARTILCTTTKFMGWDTIAGGDLLSADEVEDALERHRLIWLGTPARNGKWGPPALEMSELALYADYVIAEADGSAGLPLKAHRGFEPVIPPEADQTIMLLGADGLEKPVMEAAHCPRLYAERAECGIDTAVTPEIAAKVLRAEGIGTRLVINKVHSESEADMAAKISALTDMPVYAGSLLEDTICSL